MTTLDKIKAEIQKRYDDCEEDWENGEQYGYWNCLKIIDKYAEQEPTTRQSCKNCKQDPKECGNDAHYGFCQNWEYAEQEPNSDIRLNRVKNELNRVKNELKSKTGHWIGDKAYPICPKCNCNIIEEYISCSDYAEMYKPMKYCPNCGCRMVEPQESEEV